MRVSTEKNGRPPLARKKNIKIILTAGAVCIFLYNHLFAHSVVVYIMRVCVCACLHSYENAFARLFAVMRKTSFTRVQNRVDHHI